MNKTKIALILIFITILFGCAAKKQEPLTLFSDSFCISHEGKIYALKIVDPSTIGHRANIVAVEVKECPCK
jgi:hypothetical protein